MSEIAVNDLLKSLFGNICAGMISVGLSAAVEIGLPAKERIPVPRNILRPNTLWSLIQVATWSSRKYETINNTRSEPHKRTAIYAAWLCGLVAVKNKPRADDTFIDLCQYDFDAECQMVDEEINTPITQANLADFLLGKEERELLNRVISWIIASKITWRGIGHHLGTTMRQPDGTVIRQGFTAKAVRAVPIANITMDDPVGFDEVYKLVHPHSTRVVMSALYSDWTPTIRAAYRLPGWAASTDEIEQRWNMARAASGPLAPSDQIEPLPKRLSPGEVVENNSYYYAAVEWISPRFLHMKVTDDVLIRLSSLPAGFAKLADSFVALKRLLSTPLCVVAPHIDKLPELCSYYNRVKAEHMRYGKAAAYLVINPREERVDATAFAPLLATLTTFVQIVMLKSTLAAAAMYREDDRSMEGYNERWAATCKSYVRALSLLLLLLSV
ncbi:hypothetical protein Q1695_002454 [Nippostrongylus brasiliensis]|nr:hypothetical protein Q1695_002454 [Nippostrongylus brasiliensis]